MKVAHLSKTSKVRVGIGEEMQDFEADFSIFSLATFANTCVNFANEQLEDCISPEAGVVAGQLSKARRRFVILLIK